MKQVVRIGLDIAKRWFQIHAVDASGKDVLNKKLPRDKVLGFLAGFPACEVALEACSTSHYWGREIKQAWAQGSADLPELCEAVPQARQIGYA